MKAGVVANIATAPAFNFSAKGYRFSIKRSKINLRGVFYKTRRILPAAQYDRVPADIAENIWENLLTTENKRINMNEGINAGVRAFDMNDSQQHLVDSRIFVFVHRNDNYVKPEAVITGGYFTDTTVFGDVVLSKK